MARRPRDGSGQGGRRGRRPEHLADARALRGLRARPAGHHPLAVHRRPPRGLAGQQGVHPHPPGRGRGARRPDARDQTSPEAEVVTDDENARLWHALGRLPERCQKLLRIVAWEPRPDYSSVAETLDMPIGSIGPTRRRCLEKLRVELGRRDMKQTDEQLLDAIAVLYAELDPAPADLADGVLARLAVEDLESEYELLTLVDRVDDAAGTRGARRRATEDDGDGRPGVRRYVVPRAGAHQHRRRPAPARRLGRPGGADAGVPRPRGRRAADARQSADAEARRALRVHRADDRAGAAVAGAAGRRRVRRGARAVRDAAVFLV